VAAAVALGLGAATVSAPPAAAAAPWWHLGMVSRPSDLSAPSGEAELALTAINLGDAPAGGSAGPITLVDTLPPGASALKASAVTGWPPAGSPVTCNIAESQTVSCAYEGTLAPYDQIELRISVELPPGDAWRAGHNLFSVSGGGAPSTALKRNLPAGGEDGRLGIEEFDLQPEGEAGAADTQAGSHPFQVTAAVSFTQTSEATPTAMPKDLGMRLPPGLLADVGAVPQCAGRRFEEGACSAEDIVGVATLALNEARNLGVTRLVAPIFNLEPLPGQPARFGAIFGILSGAEMKGFPMVIDSSIGVDEYAPELSIRNISELTPVLGATISLWGVPEDPRHDSARGLSCLFAARGLTVFSCPPLEAAKPEAMLTLPTDCGELGSASLVEVASWADREHPSSAADPFPPMSGCNRLPFETSATARATASAASSPSGLGLSLEAPDDGVRNPNGLAESTVKRVEVTLPEEFTINPSAAGGLASCDGTDYASTALDYDGCPEASKVGSAVLESPIFTGPLTGSVYFGGEAAKRFDGSLRLYIVARNPRLGLLVKLQGLLRVDPATGRITVVADRLPQLPLSGLQLEFSQGPRALLATPRECGIFPITFALTPYSNPAATVEALSPQVISTGPGGDPCGGARFHPALIAGTEHNAAGTYSPLYVRLSRGDGEPELAGLSLALPAGLAANLSGIPPCPASALAAATTRSGTDEAAAPSCPAASRLGRIQVGTGVGPVLSYVPGTLYLAGPDRGAPYSVAAVTPALLGPLDLGTVVRRFPVAVDPRTGQLSIEFAETERLPSMLEGVALHLRELRLYLDRPHFIVNPTSCAPAAVDGSVYASNGTVAPLAQRFQAADCAALPFHPSLSLSLAGGLGRSGHPLLRVTIRSGERQARIAGATFTLPPGELLDFHHVRGLCPRRLPATHCPDDSRLGYGRLWSPLLPDPLQGAIYLREPSHGFPQLVAELSSGDIRIRIHGETGATHGRLRVRFEGLPDLPLAKAAISLSGGRRGIFVNSEDLCGRKLPVRALIQAQSGRSRPGRPALHLSGRC
jgi:hypothetical protein